MGTMLENLSNSQLGVSRDQKTLAKKQVEKWTKLGFMDGIKGEREQKNLARLLENTAAYYVKSFINEAGSTISGGNVEGYAQVAFPLVRRIFGNFILDQIISTQPMGTPNGMIFFLDFIYGETKLGYSSGTSVYGGGRVGAGIMLGVNLDIPEQGGFYNLKNGFSSPTASLLLSGVASGTALADNKFRTMPWGSSSDHTAKTVTQLLASGNDWLRDINYDRDIIENTGTYYYRKYAIQFSSANWNTIDLKNVQAIFPRNDAASGSITGTATPLLHLTKVDTTNRQLTFIVRATASANLADSAATGYAANLEYATIDDFGTGTGLGTIKGSDFKFEGPSGTNSAFQSFPELEIKLNSSDIQAKTRKLKTKWSHELAQDISAYHDVNAEVEITKIMSEHVDLEIQAESLTNLIKGATGGTFYWSKIPGKFVQTVTGTPISTSTGFGDFYGTPSEWYKTLLQKVNELSAQISRKVLKGGANFMVCGPEVQAILESTNSYAANIANADPVEKTEGGLVKGGSVSKRWDVFVTPYFPRNAILVGRKGSNFLDTGYVYAPYVPAIAFPTVAHPEDFTPRKGLMTRYGVKMIKPDYYGLIIIQDMDY